MDTGFTQGGSDTTVDVVDIGMPFGLYNNTDHTVRLRSVDLIGVPRAVHVRSVTAYLGPGIGVGDGDLLKFCRTQDPPHPVTDVVVHPHSESVWHVVIAVTFTRPGRYWLRRVKIFYTTNGQNGWQYQNLNTLETITAARKGAKPRFAGC